MEFFWTILNLVVLSFLILMCLLGTFYKHISFGWGLGDVLGYFCLFGLTILHLILTIYFWKKGIIQYNYLGIVFLGFSIYLSLKATIWRGDEYEWNGQIFYLACPTNVKIKNSGKEKELVITMCSMQYNSKFSGTWNGTQMENLKGEIKIPDKLKKFINFPVEKIVIKPFSKINLDNVCTNGYSNFDEELLTKHNEYTFSGEVVEVIDYIPVFKVRMKK